MRFLWLQSARWLGFPGGTDNYNFDIPCGSAGRLKNVCLMQGASDVVTPLQMVTAFQTHVHVFSLYIHCLLSDYVFCVFKINC